MTALVKDTQRSMSPIPQYFCECVFEGLREGRQGGSSTDSSLNPSFWVGPNMFVFL